MDCNQIAELTPLYLSAELDRERAAQFDAHLKSCPSCMKEFEEQARLDTRVREAVTSEPVDVSGVERHVRRQIGKAGVAAVLRRRWVMAAAGIAAVIVLAAGAYRLLMGPVPRVYADAAHDHHIEVIELQPRHWSSDLDHVDALADKQGIPRSAVTALGSGPYRFERGKLCFIDHRIFLHVVYTDGTGEYSFYLRQRGMESLPGRARETDNGRAVHVSHIGSERVASFQTDQLTVMVVTDQSSDNALHAARFAATTL